MNDRSKTTRTIGNARRNRFVALVNYEDKQRSSRSSAGQRALARTVVLAKLSVIGMDAGPQAQAP